MDKIMILGAPEFQIPLIEAAKRRGLYTLVLDMNPQAPGIERADEYIRCSIRDSAAALKIAVKERPIAVSPGMCDAGVYSAAVIAEKLGLPGLKPETALRATDKALMAEAFRKNSLPHPRSLSYRIGEALPEGLDFPLISKPPDMAGSRGVRLSRNPAELRENLPQSAGDRGRLILQEYMRGLEVSVELLILGRRAHVLEITDKICSGPPFFTELGHVQPSALPESVKKEISSAAAAAAEALELENTLAHAELIVTPRGPGLVEIGARMGGDGIQSYLLPLSSGINAPEIALSLALGEAVELPERSIKKAAAVRFLPSGEGRLKEVRGLESLRAAEGVKYSGLLSREGSLLKGARDNSGRIAYAITQGESPEEAERLCRKALEELEVIME